jgi:hypothetical protein
VYSQIVARMARNALGTFKFVIFQPLITRICDVPVA